MGEWKKSSCVLCAQNCGLEMRVENNRIVKVRGDRDNPRSRGYCCRKGLNLAHYAHNADRIFHPLKRVNGVHERIGWEQAIREISEKVLAIRERHGPRALAYMGGGGTGGQMEVGVGVPVLRMLGSHYYYSALAQEFSNIFWVDGRVTGRQGLITWPDPHRAETVVAWGWNGWMSNQEPRARELLRELQSDPRRRLIVIDPRLSETADRADIHLALRPGSDTALLKAMIRLILDHGWVDQAFIDEHVNGWDDLEPLFEGFPARRAVEEVCGLEYDRVLEVTRLIARTGSCIHEDLGIFMNRHSTINCYLLHILRAITGRFCVEGGHLLPAYFFPIGADTDERNPKIWRTVKHDMFPVMGTFPPAILPDEIMNDHPERLRALLVSACNPLRSYPDTLAYERAFAALELSVSIEVAYTETARLCDYVLPCLSYMETYDSPVFSYDYPDLFFQMRQPVLQPLGEECREGSAIILELARAMGLVPELPQSLYEAGRGGITAYLEAVSAHLQDNPLHVRIMPLILAETLGRALGSVNQALVVGLLLKSSEEFKAGAVAGGYPDDFTMIGALFEEIRAHPEGSYLVRFQGDNFSMLATADRKLALKIDELLTPLEQVTVESELADLAMPREYPLILHAGLHLDTVANTYMRDPAWNRNRRWTTMLVHETDAARLGLVDGETARIITRASRAEIEVEISPRAARGCVYIRHGGGLIYGGVKHGVNVNELVLGTDRDEMCTPMHRRIPCRLEKI